MIEITAESLLSQDTLRQVEALCTQEEPPACEAACPLHLDVRSFNAHIKEGKTKEAYKLYAKAIPFPSIIACTCDAPCQSVCKRRDLGGSIEIRKLEQAMAAAHGKPAKPPMLFPKKDGKAAIIGGGLRGMAAALDLCKKGYKVTIFEKLDRLGGKLWQDDNLPKEILQAEVEALAAFPITIEYNSDVDISCLEQAEALLGQGFDTAYIACQSGIETDGDSQQTENPCLLAGSRSGRITEGDSSIYDVYDGRSAATTMDRLMQGVSVEAGRAKEGSFETQLYTNLDEIEAVPTIDGDAYDDVQAAVEAGRCIQCECLECVKKCGFMQHYKSYPRKFVREVYNNLSIAMGIHHANTMINACALCGQCEAICPNGFDMKSIFRAARESMTNNGKMPPSAFEFALLDMEYSMSDSFFMARHQPGMDESRYLFFPGCQLSASEPGLVKRVYEDISGRLEGGVGLMLGCCGVMAKWAGDEALYRQVDEQLKSCWQELGCPTIIAGCPTCASTLSGIGMDVTGIYDVLGELGISGNADVPELYLHHACGARYDDAVKASVGKLAGNMGIKLTDKTADDEQSPCCGYGGLVAYSNDEVADDITTVALEQMGDKPTLTYCVNCRDRYINRGSESYHLLELIYSDVEAKHAWPTWSQRQDNRANLKRGMLEGLWQEKQQEADRMQLYIDDALRDKLEHTHILESDISSAIKQAEEENSKMMHPETKHNITSYRPRNVTFWVEYEPEGDGWRVHNAYCHRIAAEVTSNAAQPRED